MAHYDNICHDIGPILICRLHFFKLCLAFTCSADIKQVDFMDLNVVLWYMEAFHLEMRPLFDFCLLTINPLQILQFSLLNVQ